MMAPATISREAQTYRASKAVLTIFGIGIPLYVEGEYSDVSYTS